MRTSRRGSGAVATVEARTTIWAEESTSRGLKHQRRIDVIRWELTAEYETHLDHPPSAPGSKRIAVVISEGQHRQEYLY
jgi:hypothetical protein